LQQPRIELEPNGSEKYRIPSTWRIVVLLVACLFASAAIPVEGTQGTRFVSLATALDPLSYRYPSSLQTTLGALGKGITGFSEGRFATALELLPADSAARTSAVADYVVLYRAKAYLELGRGKEASELFRALQEQYPDSPLYSQAGLGLTRAYLLMKDPSGALEALDRGHLTVSSEVLSLRAQVLEAQGKTAEAIDLYLRLYADYVGSVQSDSADSRLRLLAPTFLTRPENRDYVLRRAEGLIRAGRSSDARLLLTRLGTAAGATPARQILLLADADTNLKLLEEALSYLSRIKQPDFAAQVNYLQGICYRGLRNEPAFLATRDRALQLHPRSPFTEKLLYSVATYFDLDNKMTEAREAYQAIASNFPAGEYIERALWKVGLYLYLDKHYAEALHAFWQCLLANPSAGAASAPAYWMGRSCEKLGDLNKAGYLYGRVQALANYSYYGQRARESFAGGNLSGPSAALDPEVIDFAQVSRTLDAIHPNATTFPEPSSATVHIIERARQLAAAGLLSLSLAELEHGYVEGDTKDKALGYALSRVYAGKNDPLSAIVTLRRAFPDYVDMPPSSLPEEVWSLLFPVRHHEIVTKVANRKGLDPNLVLGLIRQESAFQESARSKADARGLMQVLPSTGRMLARQEGMLRFTPSSLYIPETNITLGVRHLSTLLQRYNGRVELALAAYNAGENRVDRWLQEFGNVDMPEFVERIPFSETRGYVKTVLSNRAHYHLHSSTSSGLANTLRKE
jgi:soluble lytic murein transglycosylase